MLRIVGILTKLFESEKLPYLPGNVLIKLLVTSGTCSIHTNACLCLYKTLINNSVYHQYILHCMLMTRGSSNFLSRSQDSCVVVAVFHRPSVHQQRTPPVMHASKMASMHLYCLLCYVVKPLT